MSIPTPYVVLTEAYGATVTDDYGNDVETWAEGVPQRVHGWAPTGSFEEGNRERSVTAEIDLFCPVDFTVGPHDRIVVAGTTYEVDGEIRDYTASPYPGSIGGKVVSLKRWS